MKKKFTGVANLQPNTRADAINHLNKASGVVGEKTRLTTNISNIKSVNFTHADRNCRLSYFDWSPFSISEYK